MKLSVELVPEANGDSAGSAFDANSNAKPKGKLNSDVKFAVTYQAKEKIDRENYDTARGPDPSQSAIDYLLVSKKRDVAFQGGILASMTVNLEKNANEGAVVKSATRAPNTDSKVKIVGFSSTDTLANFDYGDPLLMHSVEDFGAKTAVTSHAFIIDGDLYHYETINSNGLLIPGYATYTVAPVDFRNDFEKSLDGKWTPPAPDRDPTLPDPIDGSIGQLPEEMIVDQVTQSWWDTVNVIGAGASGFAMGSLQGVANGINGVQDIAVGLINMQRLTNPTTMFADPIESIDWARGLVTHESGEPGSWSDTHGWSKFLVGDGAVTLLTMGAGKVFGLLGRTAPTLEMAPRGGYLNPGIGSAVPGQNFSHGWIKHDLYNQLNGLVGKADMNKFLAALKKGIVGPTGESGIKIFSSPVGKYTHELKIGGSAQRLLGYIEENGVLIFDKFVRGGFH